MSPNIVSNGEINRVACGKQCRFLSLMSSGQVVCGRECAGMVHCETARACRFSDKQDFGDGGRGTWV